MSSCTRVLIVNNVKLSLNASFEEAFLVTSKKLKSVGVNTAGLSFSIYKKSVDARNKSDIFFVYSVRVSGEIPDIPKYKLEKISAQEISEGDVWDFERGSEPLSAPPVVVGSGPCGLFAALILAEAGYKPIVIERGGSVAERRAAVLSFNLGSHLNTETNIQFGAGGAGTFSDGKLVTRINDAYCSYVLRTFVEYGAPEEILYQAKPHVGTDVISVIVEKMLDKICKLGGEVRYHTRLIGIESLGERKIARTTTGDIEYGALILAIGHSARDTYEYLINSGYAIEPKSFSVGMRIEHLARKIDEAMYGSFAGHPALAHAEYNLSHNTKERGVYTFCMCPGGEVVAAASEEGGTVVNGMSNHKRSGRNSNSAVVCSIFKEDYGNSPVSAIEFQRKIERAAFKAGGEDYSAPIITVGDFLSGECNKEPDEVIPTYKDGKFVTLSRPEKYLPEVVCNSIKGALVDFDKKIHGFAANGAVLTGAETRTSAPLRLLRNPETRLALGKEDIYPAGEGAGYAGGITSAAVDGIRTAIAVMKRFKP